MKRKYSETVNLSVPGGLAGQIFAVGYGAWISKNLRLPVHINFYDVGSDISQFGVEALVLSQTAKDLGISYSQIMGNLNWASSASSPFTMWAEERAEHIRTWAHERANPRAWDRIRTVYRAISSKEWDAEGRPSRVKTGVITLETLQSVTSGEHLVGYPTDYRVIEEAWQSLSAMIQESQLPNFARDTGKEESLAIHWRLGDYVNNNTHGSIDWSAFENCLTKITGEETPIKIFTDSPALAKKLVGSSLSGRQVTYISRDIWSDLFEMTRSKTFIASNSGVSILAAIALRSDNSNSWTWLPDRWFVDARFNDEFARPEATFNGSSVYTVKFDSEV